MNSTQKMNAGGDHPQNPHFPAGNPEKSCFFSAFQPWVLHLAQTLVQPRWLPQDLSILTIGVFTADKTILQNSLCQVNALNRFKSNQYYKIAKSVRYIAYRNRIKDAFFGHSLDYRGFSESWVPLKLHGESTGLSGFLLFGGDLALYRYTPPDKPTYKTKLDRSAS